MGEILAPLENQSLADCGTAPICRRPAALCVQLRHGLEHPLGHGDPHPRRRPRQVHSSLKCATDTLLELLGLGIICLLDKITATSSCRSRERKVIF